MSLQRLLILPRKEGKLRRPLEPESLRVSEPLLGGRAEGGGEGETVCVGCFLHISISKLKFWVR